MTKSSSAEQGAAVQFPPPLIFLMWTLVGVVVHYGVARVPIPVERVISGVGGVLILLVGKTTMKHGRRFVRCRHIIRF